MSNSIYEEALADAKALKLAAEERVKQKLVESMSPKIKLLIENHLLEQLDEEATEECGYAESDLNEEDGTEEVVEDQDNNDLGESLEEDYDLIPESNQSKNVISQLMTENYKKVAIENKLSQIKENMVSLKSAIILSENKKINKSQNDRINHVLDNLTNDLESLKENSIINSDKSLLKMYLNISKELNNMSTKRRNKLNETLEDLLETYLFEEEEGEEEELDLDSLMDDQDEPSAEIGPETTVEDLAQLAGLLPEEGDEEEDAEEEEEDLEGEEEPEGEEEAPEDEDLAVEGQHMGEEEEEEEMNDADQNETVYEIDENMLREEIGKMKQLRESDAESFEENLVAEMFADEGDEINEHDEIDSSSQPTLAEQAAIAKKVVRDNRILAKQLKEYKSALSGMKKQLSEMNLFNAKLLYVNKLMQNRDLSVKQQRHIVESLDDAKTLNEAKLLFESLSKTLNKSGTTINESASRRILGSSSKSVSSSQPKKGSQADLDRWAKLAGLK